MSKETTKKDGFFVKVIKGIEVAGNKLPHPFWLFMGLWAIVLALSAVFEGVSVQKPGTEDTVAIMNLLSHKGFDWSVRSMVKNFAGFPPLGLVLVMMIGLGVTTKSGFLENLMKNIAKVPEKFIILAVFLFGICGNLASDAAIVIVPPLTGALFFSMRKNPIFGLVVGYGAVCAGFTANLFIAGTDLLLAGISTTAYQIVKPGAEVYPTANYFFMVVSTFVISGLASIFVSKFMMPSFGQWDEKFEHCQAAEEMQHGGGGFEVSEQENKAFRSAMIFTAVYWIGLISYAMVPGSILRDPVKDVLIPSPFIKGLVPILLLYFILVGVIYGKKAGTIKTAKELVNSMVEGVGGMASYIVIILPIANFIAAFSKSNMAIVMAVKLAEGLKNAGFTGFSLLVMIILFSTFVNLFITSGSTKWAFMAPVIVPMLYYLGYSPQLAQLLYRIGDSCTNSITPMMPYFPILLGFAAKYDKDAGIGTIVSRGIPLSIFFAVAWITLLAVWYFLNLPLGPGAGIFVG
ncbi:AbgT putative transporter [Dethiosulfovibrio peptidovorans DSM 11002]|uniref:AbgT putative transporter n=1 Tax=Dethiosulfovibrio peptidovorans DSM 11002 TaxID=469381 RepID=D2Z8P5_9BACT|nr:AbgT family transporter [Dethiosulfovibrio peptidovorans]EFC91842.1 AbgT putative transporter [Dethiosulfovibrio peptidovorans DSM 11002]